MRTVKEARLLSKLTQQQLAAFVGITLQTVSNIETGRHIPKLSTRQKLERRLGDISWNMENEN